MVHGPSKTRHPLKPREISLLVAGLIVGLLAGALIIGSSDSLRESLFGSAASDETEDLAAKSQDTSFYLVELSVAQTWLTDKSPDPATSEKLTTALDVIARLPTAPNEFRQNFQKAESEINEVVLPQMYAALVGVEDPNTLRVDPANPTEVCLGLDDDPYSLEGPVMYLYLTVPNKQAKQIEIPKEWEKLDAPKDDLYWQLLACYPDTRSDAK